ncbi:hypothetical protein AZZ65_002119, partial [Escherichia coli]
GGGLNYHYRGETLSPHLNSSHDPYTHSLSLRLPVADRLETIRRRLVLNHLGLRPFLLT